jgi:hypothetical protein
MDGSSATQDLSSSGRTITKYGDVYSTNAPSSPVEQALLFNRTDAVDYLVPSSTGVTLNQDWCWECRVYITGYSGGTHPNDLYMIFKPYNGSTSGVALEIKGNGKWSIFLSSGSAYAQSADSVPLNRFVHLAATKQGSTYRLFQDGKQQNLSSGGDSITNTTAPGSYWQIGGDSSVGNGRSLNGYMRDMRLTFGQARYTDDFFPPGVGTTNALMFSCNT